MEKKPFDVDRVIYKSIKKINRQQLTDLLSDIYDTGRRDYDLDELREVIGAVNGIQYLYSYVHLTNALLTPKP